MKVAVVSDIHANRQAFEAVLEAVADSEASELWCLGDIVGYGADPDACVELARRHVAVAWPVITTWRSSASFRLTSSRVARASRRSGRAK